jgi:hypothetical protein
MTNKLNNLGIIKLFNGMDVLQTCGYVKINCPTYINKIVEHHGLQSNLQSKKHAKLPIPMCTDSTYLAELELTDCPNDPDEICELEKEMGFNYRQVIGEAIFAMTLCPYLP